MRKKTLSCDSLFVDSQELQLLPPVQQMVEAEQNMEADRHLLDQQRRRTV